MFLQKGLCFAETLWNLSGLTLCKRAIHLVFVIIPLEPEFVSAVL